MMAATCPCAHWRSLPYTCVLCPAAAATLEAALLHLLQAHRQDHVVHMCACVMCV